MIDRATRMGSDRLGPLLARFVLPVIVSMVAGSLYNLADRVFVGRGVGQTALAGVTVAFPFFMLVYSVALLLGVGASALVSINLGKGDREAAERAAGTALSAGTITALVLVAVGLLCLDPLLTAFGGSGAVLDQARSYSRILLPGSLFQVVAIILSMIVRAQGNPATAFAAGITGVLINLVLDPLFIFLFKWGVQGAAWATIIGEFVSCAWLLLFHVSRRGMLRLSTDTLRPDTRMLGRIAAIGMAQFATQIAMFLMIVASNRAVAEQGGTEAIACMGIIYVIYPLILQPLAGLSGGSQPIVGYNLGAGLLDRVRGTLRIAAATATLFCVAAWIIILAAAGPIVALFQPEPHTVALGAWSLRIFFSLLPVVGIQVIGAGYFQAVAKPGIALINSLLHEIIIILPLLVILPTYLGLDGVWFSKPVSDLIAAIITGSFVVIELRTLKANSVPPAAAAGA